MIFSTTKYDVLGYRVGGDVSCKANFCAYIGPILQFMQDKCNNNGCMAYLYNPIAYRVC